MVTKFHIQPSGTLGKIFCSNDLSHMTNMAAIPIYGKTIKKSSSPEPIDQWPWNLVCSIVYGSTTKVGQIWLHRLLYGEQWKLFIFYTPVWKTVVLCYTTRRPSVRKLFRFRVTLLQFTSDWAETWYIVRPWGGSTYIISRLWSNHF